MNIEHKLYGAEIFLNTDATVAAVRTIRERTPGFPRRVPKRCHIYGMSANSARHLRRLLSYVKHTNKMSFLTFTYPENVTVGKLKRDIDVFGKHLRRKFPQAWAIWKVEKQRRGAWHIHFLLVNVPYWRWQDVVATWARISGQPADRATNIKQVRTLRQLRLYLAKYVAKRSIAVDEQTGEILPIGRIWGVINRQAAVFEVDSAYCTVREYFRLNRITRKLRFRPFNPDHVIFRAGYVRQLLRAIGTTLDRELMSYSRLTSILFK